jgi:predicted esterase
VNDSPPGRDPATLGRLTFRPGTPEGQGAEPGLRTIGTAGLYVPEGLDERPGRLVVLLHGAGGRPDAALRLLQPLADRSGLVLLAPKSVGQTWDMIASRFGPDVRALDELIEDVSSSVPVSSCAIGGFSDGASYALSLGVSNGDVFDSVLAFSPGFMTSSVRNGSPRCFVSHGTRDAVLPIDMCSRRLVPRLRQAGYDVTYREFDGPHEVPASIATEAVRWLGHTANASTGTDT